MGAEASRYLVSSKSLANPEIRVLVRGEVVYADGGVVALEISSRPSTGRPWPGCGGDRAGAADSSHARSALRRDDGWILLSLGRVRGHSTRNGPSGGPHLG